MKQTYKRLWSLLLAACMVFSVLPAGTAFAAEAENYLVLADSFDSLGTWTVNDESGIAEWNNLRLVGTTEKQPASTEPALATISVETAGTYYLWVNCKHFLASQEPSRRFFNVSVNGTQVDRTYGQVQVSSSEAAYEWEGPIAVNLTVGTNTVSLLDTSGDWANYAGILLTNDAELDPAELTYQEVLDISVKKTVVPAEPEVDKMEDVTISTDFPGGGVVVVSKENNVITLDQDLSQSIEGEYHWFYWNFKVTSQTDRLVKFNFKWASSIGDGGVLYSTDGDKTWNYLGRANNSHQYFNYHLKAGQTVHFACALPYQYADMQTWLQELEALDNDLISVDYDFAQTGFETFTQEQIDAGLANPNNGGKVYDIPMITLGSPDAPKYLFFTARMHACETVASFVLEGVVNDFAKLPADDSFWDEYCIYVVPMMDVEGVENGDQGKNRAPHDHNRDWADGEEIYNVTKAIKAFVTDLTAKGKKVEVSVDFHCPYLFNWAGNYIAYGDWNTEEIELFAEILENTVAADTSENKIGFDFSDVNSYSQNITNDPTKPDCKNWFYKQGAVMTCSLETLFTETELLYEEENLHQWGTNIAVSLREFLIKVNLNDDVTIHEAKVGDSSTASIKESSVVGQLDMYYNSSSSVKAWNELGSVTLEAGKTATFDFTAIGQNENATGKYRLAATEIRLTDSEGNETVLAAKDVFTANGAASENFARADGLWLTQNYTASTIGKLDGCSVLIDLLVDKTDTYKIEIYAWSNQDGGIYQLTDLRGSVAIQVPEGTDLTAVTPELTVDATAKVSPEGAQDFSNGPVCYTVTAENGDTKTYLVTVAKVDQEPESVDKTALQTAVTNAGSYQEADYTAQSWSSFASALSNAQSVLNSETATQTEVDSAKTALDAAIAALKPVSTESNVLYSESFDTLPADLASTAGWELVKVKDGYALKGTSGAGAGLLGTFASVGQLDTPYTIVMDVMMLGSLNEAGFSAGLTFGKTSDNTYYHYRMDNGTGQHAQLYQWSNGSVNKKLFSSEYAMEVEAYIPFRLRVTYDGTTITCYTNGTQTYTIDRTVDTGYAGLRIYNTVAYVDNLTIYSGVVEPENGDTPSLALPEGDVTIWNNEDDGYVESSGTWSAVTEVGQDGSDSREAQGGAVSFSNYPPDTGRFTVSYYLPAADTAAVDVVITTLDGMWKYTIPAESAAGWYELGTVSATAGTAFSLTASSEGKLYADAVKLAQTQNAADAVYNPTGGGSTEIAVLVNQIGYDYGTSKRATIPNVEDGTEFKVINSSTGAVAYTGTVLANIADFTELDTVADTDFYIECQGKQSYVFTIGEDVIQRRSVETALAFMNEVRSDTFCVGSNSIAWRDSHQFSFELNGLVLQYMANPALYDSMPYSIMETATCEYEELRVQDEPDIIWLIQFAALRYYDWGCVDGKNLHGLTKEQLAYFLYIYPQISQYVSEETYEKIRDYTISVWGVNACNVQWYSVANTNHDLYSLQTIFGGLKGSQPPGHSIVPNLLMYEVAKRDGLGEDVAQKFFDAAYANCAWLIGDEFDLNDPFYNKGQRMSEYITIPALSYFLEVYPDQAPEGLEEAIQKWAETTIARSNNMWDIRMAVSEAAGDFQYYFHNPSMSDVQLSTEYWTGAAYANADKQSEYLSGGAPRNEPGNQAGLQAVTYAAARVLNDGDTAERLKELGVAAIDDLFGRNPSGRAAFYHFTRDFEGGDLGWYKQYSGGAGVLEGRTGVIDANAPEACYPYNPEAYNTGYTEGWIAYNTAWNASLAYSAAEGVTLSVSADSGNVGDEITITLHAPINLDNTQQESGYVFVTNLLTGKQEKVTVTESGTSSDTMTAVYTLPNANAIRISYGYGLFENSAEVEITDFEADKLESVTVSPAQTTVAIGESVTLNAAILPADANNQRLTWTSSNETIATVEAGKVTGVSEGTVTVTVTGWDGTYGTAEVTVSPAKAAALVIDVPETISILDGGMKASLTGIELTNGQLVTENLPQATFSTTDTDILSVSEDGMITGLAAGEAEITVSATIDEQTLTKTAIVTVTASKTYDLLELYRAEKYTNNGVTPAEITAKDSLNSSYGQYRMKLTGGAKGNDISYHLGEIAKGLYSVTLNTKYYETYGTWSFRVGGCEIGSTIDFNNEERNGDYHNVSLGQVVASGGEIDFTFVSENGGTLVPVSVTLTAADITTNVVVELINAIGEVTLDSGNTIAAARTAYDALSDAQKESVTNYQTLMAAEREYAVLESAKNADDAKNAAEAAEVAKAAAEQALSDAVAAQAKAEKAQKAAEKAQTDAVVAQKAAEEAAKNAGTNATAAANAKGAAEDAKKLAEAAQTAAEQAKSDAVMAQTNAQTAQQNAEIAQTAAEAAEKAAKDSNDAAAQEAKNAATKAANAATEAANAAGEALKSATSASEAATSASESASYAAAAAQSAKDAQVAQKAAEDAAKKAEADKKATEEAKKAAEAAQAATEKALLECAKYEAVMKLDLAAEQIDRSGYTADQVEAHAAAVSVAKEAIAAAETLEGVEKALDEGKTAIGAVEEMKPVIPFVDIEEDMFCYDAVLWAVEKGITKGKDTTHFDPSGDCTRAQVVTFLWRAAGEPEPKDAKIAFPDVAADKYYTKAVTWAVENGITTGYKDGTFGPNDTCTRGQIVTFLWRYAGEEDTAANANFPDVAVGKYYGEAVMWAVKHGITAGYKDGTFGPDKTCTRDQIVTFLYRYYVEN